MTYETNYLAHHGILGQKWGVRRFQNPDGSLTPAGKARLAKNLQKDFKKSYDSSQPYKRTESYKNTIKDSINKYNIITENDRAELKQRHKSYSDALSKYFNNDYYDSDEYLEDYKKAYSDTKKWFEKNDPSYLKEIIEKNGGDEASLDNFHDFRKTLEGYEDMYYTKGQEKWDKTHNTKQLENELKKVEKEYYSKCQEVGEKLLGEYGNVYLNNPNKYESGRTINNDIRDIVDSIIFQELNSFTINKD